MPELQCGHSNAQSMVYRHWRLCLVCEGERNRELIWAAKDEERGRWSYWYRKNRIQHGRPEWWARRFS